MERGNGGVAGWWGNEVYNSETNKNIIGKCQYKIYQTLLCYAEQSLKLFYAMQNVTGANQY